MREWEREREREREREEIWEGKERGWERERWVENGEEDDICSYQKLIIANSLNESSYLSEMSLVFWTTSLPWHIVTTLGISINIIVILIL